MLLEDVSVAQVRRGDRDMWLSEKHAPKLSWKRFKLLKSEVIVTTLPPLSHSGPQGVPSGKLHRIVDTLCPLMTRSGHENRTRFWRNLPTDDASPDLCTRRDKGETELGASAPAAAPPAASREERSGRRAAM